MELVVVNERERDRSVEYVAWVVDPSSAVRSGLTGLLKAMGFTRVVSASTGRGLLSQVSVDRSLVDNCYLVVSEYDYSVELEGQGAVVDFIGALKGDRGGLYKGYDVSIAPQAAIVVYTGLGVYETVFEAVTTGVDGYILKPTLLSDVEKVVGSLLTKKRTLLSAYRLIGEGKIEEGVEVARELFVRKGNQAAGKLAVMTLLKQGKVVEAQRLIYEAKPSVADPAWVWAYLVVTKLTLPQAFMEAGAEVPKEQVHAPSTGLGLLERVLEHHPHNAEVWEAVYHGYMERGDVRKAGEALKRCVELAGQNVEYLQAYAMHLYKSNDAQCVDYLVRACRVGRKSKLFNYSTLVLAFLSLQYTEDRQVVRAVLDYVQEGMGEVERLSKGSVRMKVLGHVFKGLNLLGVPRDGGVNWVSRYQAREFEGEMREAIGYIGDDLLDFDTAQALLYTLKRYGNLIDGGVLRDYVLAYARRYLAPTSGVAYLSAAFDVLPAARAGAEVERLYGELKTKVSDEHAQRLLKWCTVSAEVEKGGIPAVLRECYEEGMRSLNLCEVIQSLKLVVGLLAKGGLSEEEERELERMRVDLRGVILKTSRGAGGVGEGASFFVLSNGACVSPLMWLMKRRY